MPHINEPSPAVRARLITIGATRDLLHSDFKQGHEQDEFPETETTHDNAWLLPASMDIRAANKFLVSLGYVRARDRYRDHFNFDGTDGLTWAQTFCPRGTRRITALFFNRVHVPTVVR